MPPNKFHLWIPELFQSTGGIQLYSTFLLTTLRNLYPQAHFSVYLKHDAQISRNFLNCHNICFYHTGSFPQLIRTPVFAARLISQGIWQQPDLIISTHLNFAPAAYLLKRFTGIPYWVVAYGVDAWDITNPRLQIALNHADRILTVSDFTRSRLLEQQNLEPENVVTLPSTFDADQFFMADKPAHLLHRYGLLPNQPILLTVGRLSASEQYKGHDQILAALPTIRQTIPDIHYIVVGEGSDRPRIEQLITQLQLQDCVTLAGFVPDRELCDYYNLCDVFTMPSKREGFGIVYLEAMACGKPVLGGNQDGALDALRQGELGALVNPDDVSEIAQTVIQILQKNYPNPLIYQPERLRQKAIETFGLASFKATLGQYLDDYFMNRSVSVGTAVKKTNHFS